MALPLPGQVSLVTAGETVTAAGVVSVTTVAADKHDLLSRTNSV